MRNSGRCVALVALLACVLTASPAFAQAGRAEIRGSVADSSGGVLPGVTVIVIEANTGVQRTVVTDAEGRFVIPTLTPGTYTVKVELASFQTQVRELLALAVGQELSLEFSMAPASLAEEVTIRGEAPVIEVSTNRIGTNITNQEIDSLPSASRNQMALMQLVPGLTPSLDSGQSEGGQYNANGRETGSTTSPTRKRRWHA